MVYIKKQLLDAYKDICSNLNNSSSNRVYNTMMRATKSTTNKLNNASICKFLVALRRNGVGTNEVEHNIRRLCKETSINTKNMIKSRIMRWKINDAYKNLRKCEYEDRQVWKESKRDIPP